MYVIFRTKHMIWHKLQFVHILSLIMHYHTVKCALRCYADCTFINIPDQETDSRNLYTTPSIRFHIYHIIAGCNAHVRIPMKYKNVTCVNNNLHQMNIQKYTPEKS